MTIFTNKSILYRLAFCAVMMLSFMAAQAQNAFTTKVYGLSSEGRYYGRLYVPKGGKWRISKSPADNVKVTVYAGHVDGSDIYLNPVLPQEGYVWIDATATDHIFVVRSTATDDVTVEPVTAEQDAAFLADDYTYYGASQAKKNRFRYASEQVSPATMKESSTYNKRNVYVMANPAKYGMAFGLLNPDASMKGLAKGSLYVLAKKSSASRLNVIFNDEEEDFSEATGIQTVSQPKSIQSDNTVYSILGTPVSNPQSGQVYIRNGRKYIVK